MPDVAPDPKPVTEGGIGRKKPDRGNRRRGRVTASRDGWIALRAEKLDGQPCAVCGSRVEKDLLGPFQLHHLVPRSLGGDDVADNLVAVHPDCHMLVGMRNPRSLAWLAANLTSAEYAYVVGKLGEGAMNRLFGV